MSDTHGDPTIDTDHPAPDDPATAGGDTVVDLDRVTRDLDGVEAALRRLDDGTYWSDEVTGEEIPDEVLATDPTARRAEPASPWP